ncbi:hypothetical protein DI09_14p310 [Mitosporidium daphniae]|uniref:CTLH/CRA C-terminal to LisH motif domain-containing protein n=1 Tax=Mitosporidium daphniae TaxID=1485682 RepID=A0A098VU42_9MICR|nr:uncharacterized protein DI09_56p130 [Mitosporidium daphniae]XP_013239075.1 uncharacterized protein DI09_14p310 [Mitosporidium daphniae]KGG50775.1 hypothetical protein DI09_56p130 [Mitosporidium daphniae]KGG52648.1 hypothetical protein DI09_14p310 [Mitosporidium daphniae]|eukprot:XP_013237202.1 uncharacterized protein DI09_56p130 [Mitosporidium daphniae]
MAASKVLCNTSPLFQETEGIELLLRIEEFRKIEDKLQALEYAQLYFPALGTDSPMLSTAIRKAMTLLACPEKPPSETQTREKWKVLGALFKAAACQCFGTLPLRSILQIYLEAGLAILKTPQCRPDAAVKRCPLCTEPDLFKLADCLPLSRNDSSQVICRISGEIISGGGLSNAIALPNGQVFSERAIGVPDADGFITCPLTGEKFNRDRIQKIYFL